jgi:hypothetical protein
VVLSLLLPHISSAFNHTPFGQPFQKEEYDFRVNQYLVSYNSIKMQQGLLCQKKQQQKSLINRTFFKIFFVFRKNQQKATCFDARPGDTPYKKEFFESPPKEEWCT